MIYNRRFLGIAAVIIIFAALNLSRVHTGQRTAAPAGGIAQRTGGAVTAHYAVAHDVSQPLASLAAAPGRYETAWEGWEFIDLPERGKTGITTVQLASASRAPA